MPSTPKTLRPDAKPILDELFDRGERLGRSQWTSNDEKLAAVKECLDHLEALYLAELKPKVMPKYRRRSLTPQERSFEAEVASFVKAYPNMTLKDYWLGRWHQTSNLGAAQLTAPNNEEEET
jgi:hypothetical protein